MHVFIDFWKLETENNLLHIFSFLHKLNFENSFCFLLILSCQTSFLVLKIENCFWKQKIREKKTVTKHTFLYPQKIEEFLSTRMNACSKFSQYYYLRGIPYLKSLIWCPKYPSFFSLISFKMTRIEM